MAEQGFFDMREKLTAPRRPAESSAGIEPLSVTQVTRLIDTAIKSGVPAAVAVRGEVSNFNLNRASGHAYFTLKDPTANINCVMFRGEFSRVKFQPTDGMELLATGGVRVYAAQGRYQLYVNQLQPLGKGALELALAQLREKLAGEGLFEAARKRPIPRFPASIVIVSGRIEGDDSAIAPKTTGRILEIRFREGDVVGMHEVVLDSSADKIYLCHDAKSRQGFADGAVRAAEWIAGKKGFYDFKDVWREL